MKNEKIDLNSYLLKIRHLAAAHHSGADVKFIRISVEKILKEMKSLSGKEKECHAIMWLDFIPRLKKCIVKTASPEWNSVIYYALIRSKRKLNVSLCRRSKIDKNRER